MALAAYFVLVLVVALDLGRARCRSAGVSNRNKTDYGLPDVACGL
jgi:hypothetical protein